MATFWAMAPLFEALLAVNPPDFESVLVRSSPRTGESSLKARSFRDPKTEPAEASQT
jgi:hypothetical protein